MTHNSYLPVYFREVAEMERLGDVFDQEIVVLQNNLAMLPNDAAISTASDSRLLQWELILGIIPQKRTIEQRRMMILAILRGVGKLNENKIKTIVRTFTGGGCLASFENSKIKVKVSPPQWGEVFLFPDVERALKPLMPAHIGLMVERYYNTWADRKGQFSSWGDIKTNNSDWSELKYKVEEL